MNIIIHKNQQSVVIGVVRNVAPITIKIPSPDSSSPPREGIVICPLFLNSTNFDTYKIIPDYIKHHLQKSHGILKKMLAFLCEVYYNRDILNPRKQGFVWH